MIAKLEGMPDITYINMYKHTSKRLHMENMFERYEIDNAIHFNGITPKKSNHPFLGIGEFGCMLSHVTIISDFYKNSPDDMMIVMEDDIDISAIDNWDFSWKEFMAVMPEFEILQLIRNQGEIDQNKQDYAKLKKWDWEDKSTAGYLITKDYAKKIHDMYLYSQANLAGFPNLHEEPEFPWSHKTGPVADYALYKNFNSWSTLIFKQVLKFENQWSSTSMAPNPPEWFIKQNNEINDFWSVPRGLSEITISQ
jgi:hypothetical protein